jgi:hypothetical protein
MYYAEEAIGFLRNVLCFRETHLTIKQYEGLAHAVNSTEIRDVVAWIAQII